LRLYPFGERLGAPVLGGVAVNRELVLSRDLKHTHRGALRLYPFGERLGAPVLGGVAVNRELVLSRDLKHTHRGALHPYPFGLLYWIGYNNAQRSRN